MDPEELKAFRAELRARKLAERQALGQPARAAKTAAIEENLRGLLAGRSGVLAFRALAFRVLAFRVLAFTWPISGEADLRPWTEEFLRGGEGRRLALPEVVRRGQPMVFREWRPGCPLREQRFGVMVPAEGELLRPEVILLPPVAFDRAGYRLGYGGGYYDRTLAALAPRPLAVGVGFELSACETIHPQPWDVRLDLVVTEAGIRDFREEPPRAAR